ncbi:ROK family transcriptional regulator [uncultured Cetobacterium sp.]|uniref:ROK family transcriptional regulator n=1 Tax=uncultured Cetobacterium sp. TaxID=527638 RepID=UPI00261279D7|nr:ROK family transcriptional regulator [uncultured Cetobacterium sp.]
MKFTGSQLKILEMIKENRFISRKKIAEELKLTPPAITKALEPLLQENVVLEHAMGKSTGGRKPVELILNEEWLGKVLGISLTPTSLVVTVGSVLGEIIESYTYNINLKTYSILELEEIIEKELEKRIDIRILSIVSTGLINPETGVLIFSPHYNWKKINLKSELEKKFKLVILVENDVRAMALTEKYFGNCKDSKDYVVLNISEGVGSSIFVNEKLLSGHGFMSGEIGHVVMDRTSLRRCSCGKRGCLEAEVSNLAIINRLISMIKLNNYSSLKEILNTKGKITIKDVLKAVEKRDFLSTKVSTEAMVMIAHSIDMIISLLNPEKIVLMGDIFQEKLLMSTLKLELQKVTLDEQKYDLSVSKILDKVHIYNPISVVIHNLFKKEIWRR